MNRGDFIYYKSYIGNYDYYVKYLNLKKEYLIKKDIRKVIDIIPKNKEADLSITEIENYASYYLSLENFNEMLAYYYALQGYRQGSRYCAYLLGIIYELGIFVPSIQACAKYFYQQVNAKELENLVIFDAVEPKYVDMKIDDEFFNFDPTIALIDGLKLICSCIEDMPDLEAQMDGLNLIRKAEKYNYVEAKYILGCLYFDFNQGYSRLWNKGQLVSLEANAYLSVQYFNDAISLGHETSMFIMIGIHCNKGHNEMKVQGKTDDILLRHYCNILYKYYQYTFIKDLGLHDQNSEMKYDFYKIRFKEVSEYAGECYSQLIDAADDAKVQFDPVIAGNCILAACNLALNNKYYLYYKRDSIVYIFIFGTLFNVYLNGEQYKETYQTIKLGVKLNVFPKSFSDIAYKVNISDFDIAYQRLNILEY